MSLLVGNSLSLTVPVAGKKLPVPKTLDTKTSPPPLKLPSPKWCGKYCVAQVDNSTETVGPKALKRSWLQTRLGEHIAVEPTVSIPFGTLREVLEHHHENVAANATVTNRLKAAADLNSDTQRLEWASELKKCRDAVHQLAIPDLMRSDLLECLFQQQMTVPTHRNSWERFRLDLAGAFAQLFSPAVMQALPSCPLELPVSLLIKDIAMREYDFSVSVNSQGEVSGEVRLPHSSSRGFHFAAASSGSSPATVRLPMPGFGRSQDTCAVVLDGVQVPQSVALHHAEATGMMDPPKTSGWEGDNMMILPQYKEHVYKKLVHAAHVALAAMEGDFALDGIQLTGYLAPNLDVCVQDLQPVTAACDSVLLESLWLSTRTVNP